MLTKSRIQLIKESLAMANDYRTGLENLIEKYTIEDSVFVYRNGSVYEATQGYFEVKGEYDNLQEAVRNYNYNIANPNYGIRITDNKKFTVGEVKTSLVDCNKEAKVLDINRLTDIR